MFSGDRAAKPFDKIAALQNARIFSGLSDSILQEIASLATVRHLKPEEVLFSENDEAEALYVVADGALRSVRQNAKGREQVLSTEHAGALLAASPVFNGGRFYSTCIADTASRVLRLQSQDVRNLCHRHPDLLWALVTMFALRLRQYAELIETLALRNVDQRVAQHLLSVCQERGLMRESSCVIEVEMTHAEIASRIGSTREVVCRGLAHLERQGLIQVQRGRRFTIPDMPALRKFAGVTDPEDALMIAELSSEIA